MMNQEDLDLLHGHLNGNLAGDDFIRLQTLLRENAEARRILRSLATVDTKLRELGSLNARTVKMLALPPPVSFPAPSSRRVIAWSVAGAAAACVALLVCMLTTKHAEMPQTNPDMSAAIVSTQGAIAALSVKPSASFPDWMSPTASMLNQPEFPQ